MTAITVRLDARSSKLVASLKSKTGISSNTDLLRFALVELYRARGGKMSDLPPDTKPA